MPHKESNPATFNPPNNRRHITIIVLLCVFVALGGAGVQAYRVHDAGWVPKIAQVSWAPHTGNMYERYENEISVHLYRDGQRMLYAQSGWANLSMASFYVQIIERHYKHPFRKPKMQTNNGSLTLPRVPAFPAYSTIRVDYVLAPDTTKHPDVLFVEDQPRMLFNSRGGGTHLTEIQKPYPQETFDALDAYFLNEYAQQRSQSDPLYTDFPIVRLDGTDPAIPAASPARKTFQPAAPAASHRYARLEFGTPESPLIFADWIDGSKFALIYVVAPIIFLDLIGYWGIYRMTRIRQRKHRKLRGECIRCGYPLIDGLCCECGLRVDIEINDAVDV